jgi:NusA-like KH domain protein
MSNVIDMQVMRYINLFERISRVSTMNCFIYNNTIIFAVPKSQVSRAIGKGAVNVKQMGEILGRKVKVISEREVGEIQQFIADVIEPATFNKVELNNGIVAVTAGRQNKAALIGRNRVREQELQEILKKFFSIEKIRII